MRTLLLCCLAVAAVLASSNSPTPFKGQKTYVYRFDTQVSSSLIGSSPSDVQQAAATRLRADAQLQFTNDRHATLQLKRIRIAELNADLPKSQRIAPLELFERKELPVELKETLELPLSVTYTDGVVERINFAENDSTWSKNIKRAVLNMLQLNLKRNDVQGLKMQSSMPEQEQKDSPMFTLPEITLEGACEVVYTVQTPRRFGSEDDEKTPFNVSKSINFNKCEKTVDLSYGYQVNPSEQLRCLNCLRQQKYEQQNSQQRDQARFGHCHQECQPSNKDVEKSTFARFELIGKPEKYAIKRVGMTSQYVVKAQNPASQNTLMSIVVLSELTFVEQPENQKVQSFKQSSKDETLLYSNDFIVKEKRFYMYGDEEEPSVQSPFHKLQKKEQKAAHSVRQILKQWSDKKNGYEQTTALEFNRLVEVVRMSSVKEIRSIEQTIQEIAQQHEGEPNEHSKQLAMTIFQDSLASAATRNSLFVLAEKIMKSEIKPVKAVQLLKSYTSSQIAPSDSQAMILEKIAKSEVAHRSPALKQTAWLSFGQTVGAICQDKPAESQKQQFNVEKVCPRGKKEEFKKTLMSQWKNAESTYEQILALKTIGNAALDNMLEELKQIISNKQESNNLVRIEAIDALRRLRTSLPHKIQNILLPLFQNQREQPEIRMAAFSMVMYTQPEKSVIDQMVFSVITDRSQNVKSFVMTALESLSKSPSSQEQAAANHMKSALKMIKLEPEELRASRKYRVPIYVSEQENTEEQNLFVTLSSIASPSNMLPIHLSTSLRSAFNGEATEENLKLSFTQKNLEQWYEKLGEYVQQYGQDSEQDEKVERHGAKDLRAIYSSLGLKNRRSGSYYMSSSEESGEQQNTQSKKVGDSSPFGMIVIRTHDVDYTIVPISEQHLPEIVRKLIKGEKPSLLSTIEQLSEKLSSQQFRQHIAMKIGEKINKIPTTSGLPLEMLRQTSGVGSVEGELKVRFESDNLESSRGITTELKIRSSGIATHLHRAQVWSPVLVSGVSTQRTVEINAPVDMKLRLSKEKVELKLRLPEEGRVRFAAIHTLPITFTRQFDMQTRTQREARVKTISNWALEHTLREHEQREGQVIQAEGHYHALTSPQQIVQSLYTTENNVHFYFAPTERSPKEITLTASGSIFEKHSQHSRPELDSFYSKNRGFQSLYEDEEENFDHESRHKSLSEYNKQYKGQDAYKHQLELKAVAKCGQKTHHATVKFDGACDSSLKHCKLFVDATRSPMHTESNEWKLKAKLQTVLPESMRQGEEQTNKQTNEQKRALLNIESQWGSEQQSEMNVRLQAEPSRQYQQQSRFLNKIDIVAEYKLNSQQTKHMIQRVYELLKAKLFWTMQSSVEAKRSNDENVVRAQIVIDPISRRHANLTIQTPHERLRAQSIELPLRVSPYALQQRRNSYRSFGHLIQSVSNFGGAECRADERKIRTFDGVSYKAPISDCWTVLAKDCSRDEPRFVVLMKKSGEEKKIKLITPRKTIEMIGQQSESKPIVVKINGKVEKDQQELSEQGVETSFQNAYVQTQGVRVQFDGEEVKVKVSGMYKNQQCGLCGHYDNEEENDFTMPNGQRSNSLKQFHQSYVLKNEECNSANMNKFYQDKDSQEFSIQRRSGSNKRRQQQNSWFDSEESNNDSEEFGEQQQGGRKSPVKRTKTIEYQNKICFSVEPVHKCPRGSHPTGETKTVKVSFHCMERSSNQARRLQRQAREGKIVEIEDSQQRSFTEEIEQPIKCQQQSVY